MNIIPIQQREESSFLNPHDAMSKERYEKRKEALKKAVSSQLPLLSYSLHI